jgi:hypothetical protein
MLLDLIAIAARIGSWRETAHRSAQAIATSTRVTATGLDTCATTWAGKTAFAVVRHQRAHGAVRVVQAEVDGKGGQNTAVAFSPPM